MILIILLSLGFRGILRGIIFPHLHGETEEAVCKRGKEEIWTCRGKQKQGLGGRGSSRTKRQRYSLFPGLIPVTGFGLNAGEYSFPAYLGIRVSPCGPNSQHWLSALQD